MAKRDHPGASIDTKKHFVLTPRVPFVEIILESVHVDPGDFARIVALTPLYPNDPRMVEMVRQAGDASGKVPYLVDEGQTPESILRTLREIAASHLEHIEKLPAALRSTIHLLLSINSVPQGCEKYAIPALLELDRIQGEIILALKEVMKGRTLAREFHRDSQAALRKLDQDWPRLRGTKGAELLSNPLPAEAKVHYIPIYAEKDHLVGVNETCVIVDMPDAHRLRQFIPPVLQRPLPEAVPAPATGTVDWLIRDVGKIGRHFTRAVLGIIKADLAADRITLDSGEYELIDQHAQEALHEFAEKNP